MPLHKLRKGFKQNNSSARNIVYNPIDAVSVGISNNQISRECENNPYIIISEYFYFINKWNVNNIFSNLSILKNTFFLLKKFDIHYENKIRKYKYLGKLPNLLFVLIMFINVLYVIKKIRKYLFFGNIKKINYD